MHNKLLKNGDRCDGHRCIIFVMTGLSFIAKTTSSISGSNAFAIVVRVISSYDKVATGSSL